MLTITLNQLAIALLGAGAYIYQCAGYWKACALVCGTRIERNSPDPYAALAAVAATLMECEAWQAGQDAHDTPTARAAYREGWASSAGQPVAARFAAAEAAAAATSDEQPRSMRCPHCNGAGCQHDVPAGQPVHGGDIYECYYCEGTGELDEPADYQPVGYED